MPNEYDIRLLMHMLSNAGGPSLSLPPMPANGGIASRPADFPAGGGTSPASISLDRDVLNYIMNTKPPIPPKPVAPAQEQGGQLSPRPANYQSGGQVQGNPPSARGGAGGSYGPAPAQTPAPLQAATAGYAGASPEAIPVGPSYDAASPFRPMNTMLAPTVTPNQPDFASRQMLPGAGNGGTGVNTGSGWMSNPNLTAVLGNIAAAIGGPRSIAGQIGGQIAGVAQNKLFSDYINKVMSGGAGSPFANASFYGLSPELQAKAAEVGLAMSGAPLTDLVKASQADYYSAMAEQARAPKGRTGNRFQVLNNKLAFDNETGKMLKIGHNDQDIITIQEGKNNVTYLKTTDADGNLVMSKLATGPKWDDSAGAATATGKFSEARQWFNVARAMASQQVALQGFGEVITLPNGETTVQFTDPVKGQAVYNKTIEELAKAYEKEGIFPQNFLGITAGAPASAPAPQQGTLPPEVISRLRLEYDKNNQPVYVDYQDINPRTGNPKKYRMKSGSSQPTK